MLHPLLPVSPGVQHIYLISIFLVSMIGVHVLNHKKFSVDCTWSNWSSWGSCSKTCGSGTITRSRFKLWWKHDGIDCMGSSSDSTSCNTNSCPASKQYFPDHFFSTVRVAWIAVAMLSKLEDNFGQKDVPKEIKENNSVNTCFRVQVGYKWVL